MSRGIHGRNCYTYTMTERDTVRTELRLILSSVHFCNSKRYPAFLNYVVEQTLIGQANTLKERTIGVEVFGRPATYDTNSDGIVRFTAGEVRKRLAAYYHDAHHTSRLRISLPVGTYVPEFSLESHPEISAGHELFDDADDLTRADLQMTASEEALASITPDLSTAARSGGVALSHVRDRSARHHFIIPAAIAFLIFFVAGLLWSSHRTNSLESIWHPFFHDRGTILLCAGGNTLAPSQGAGLITADKATAYPYFSLQTAMSIERLSSFIERNGATSSFNFAASTPLPDLHSHPIVLLNAYNNQWTLRLVDPLRFHFSPDTGVISEQSIVDRNSPGAVWKRNPSLPESDTDDYALIARFWDTVTDNWVLVLAGLGRNGTDAASQFATSSHYTQLLRDRMGGDLGNKNIEVVLKVNVIDGKTGPPTIVATHLW
jgi:hypothetical protein